MPNPPYIPAADSLFLAWLDNFSALLTATPGTYGLTAPDAVTVAGVTAAFDAAYSAAIDPGTRTAGTVAAKDNARAVAEATVRPFAVRISRNAAVDNADKLDIGVTVISFPPTPIPAPVTAPGLSIQSQIPGQMTLAYADPLLVGKAKPFGVTGVEVFRTVGIAPAVDPNAALYAGTVTKSPFRQSFLAADAGKVSTFFCRYVTRSGPGGVAQVGPWSAPLALVVM